MAMVKNLRMAVDIGGTFVDALVFNFDDGTLETKKVSTKSVYILFGLHFLKALVLYRCIFY